MSHYVYALDNFSNAPFLVNHVHRLLLCAEMKCIQQCYLLLWAAADQKRQRYLERDLCWYWILQSVKHHWKKCCRVHGSKICKTFCCDKHISAPSRRIFL